MLIKPTATNLAKIKVIGVGGGGNNAINTMIDNYDIQGVEFIAVNTDAQALSNSKAEVKLQIGEELTRGLGSGGDKGVGRQAAEESVDLIHEHLAGSDMVFITCGMGGGTGTGAAPVIAGIAKNLGALTVAIVTKPFNFEGTRRMNSAVEGLEELRPKVDTLITVPNQRLLEIIDEKISFLEALKKVDDILGQGVKSIAHLITQTGLVNVDFADVKSIMSDAGSALMGIGEASGPERAVEAAKLAVSSPLLEVSIDGATGVLFNVIGGADMGMTEIDEAAQLIHGVVDPNANIIFGATIDQELKDTIQITVLATGFDDSISTSSVPRINVINTQPSYSQDDEPAPVKKPMAKSSLGLDSNYGDDDDEELEKPAFLRED
ncbi:cell division protein FtsZ [Candidatus Dojkabacteria bacterium]|uniref:Cell division protein FtsZ n=1 Tax=Candidatus Dojkabacteria bacterium TaxID=2099670 RepID=A0A955L366_9BACT|nr:cell division protein FtsZ [Candidatus Dojkabacteria bacterium]